MARIIVPERQGTAFGSGTLVDVNSQYGLVITNWHVVEAANGQIMVQFPDGFRSPGEVLKSDRDWDLAALRIQRPNVQPVRLSPKAPARVKLCRLPATDRAPIAPSAGGALSTLHQARTSPSKWWNSRPAPAKGTQADRFLIPTANWLACCSAKARAEPPAAIAAGCICSWHRFREIWRAMRAGDTERSVRNCPQRAAPGAASAGGSASAIRSACPLRDFSRICFASATAPDRHSAGSYRADAPRGQFIQQRLARYEPFRSSCSKPGDVVDSVADACELAAHGGRIDLGSGENLAGHLWRHESAGAGISSHAPSMKFGSARLRLRFRRTIDHRQYDA